MPKAQIITCPSCDGEDFGLIQTDDGLVVVCTVCPPPRELLYVGFDLAGALARLPARGVAGQFPVSLVWGQYDADMEPTAAPAAEVSHCGHCVTYHGQAKECPGLRWGCRGCYESALPHLARSLLRPRRFGEESGR